jgi:hypothetical protein
LRSTSSATVCATPSTLASGNSFYLDFVHRCRSPQISPGSACDAC